VNSDLYTLASFMETDDGELLSKAASFYQYVEDFRSKGYVTYRRIATTGMDARVKILDPESGGEREFVMLGSNNYLGLATHPRVIEAAVEATRRFGTGVSGAPLLNGTTTLHRELEERLAAFKRCEDAIVFPTGYSANFGAIGALVRKGDVVAADRLCHASIFDGCRVADGTYFPFRHNSAEHLDVVLREKAATGGGKLVAVEGVYSMDGDLSPLPEIVEVAGRHGAAILVDEAHATGVTGRTGRGTIEHFSLEGKVDVVMGTLSKALGSLGGFICARKEVVNYLRYYARPYFFSASPPPAQMAAAIEALKLVDEESWRIEQLWENIAYLKEKLRNLGFDCLDSRSAIIPLMIGNELLCRKMGKRLHELGILREPGPLPGGPEEQDAHPPERHGDAHPRRPRPRHRGARAQRARARDPLMHAGAFAIARMARPRESPPPPSPLDARAAAGMQGVAPGAWDALVPPGRGTMRHAFLSACEAIELAAFEFRPLVARGPDGAIAAHAPAYRYDLDYGLFATGLAARLLGATRSLLPRFLLMRVFELGCPVALCEPFGFAPGTDEREAAGKLAELALVEAGRGGTDLVIVHDFEAGHATGATRALADLGFQPIPLLPNFVLDLDRRRFESFDRYLAAMRSPYRRRARLRLARAAGLRPEVLASFAPLAPELARLFRSIYDRAEEDKREVLPAPFFRAIDGLPGVRVLALRRGDGSIASFALLLEDGPVLRFMYSGFEERAAREEGAYFRLLYEIVRYGIERGFARVNLGWTTAEPKLDLGARIVPLEAWIHHRRRARQRTLAWAMRSVLCPPAPRARRVFREADS
jgi:glycine C-acetyltransferase